MFKVWMLVLVVVLGACGTETPAGAAANLTGEWDLELYEGGGLFQKPQVVARGRLSLHEAPDLLSECREDAEPAYVCESGAVGTHDLDIPEKYSQRLSDTSAWAVIRNDGSLLIHLGGCCDQGEIEGVGKRKGDGFQGKWWQQFLEHHDGGHFTLSSADERPRPSNGT